MLLECFPTAKPPDNKFVDCFSWHLILRRQHRDAILEFVYRMLIHLIRLVLIWRGDNSGTKKESIAAPGC
jgi:hypothetical protein